MFLRKYNLLILKDNGEIWLNLKLRRWTLSAVLFFTAALIGCAIYLGGYYLQYSRMDARLAENEKKIMQQNNRLMSTAVKLNLIEQEYTRIYDFNTKLRVMLSLGQRPESHTAAQPMGSLEEPSEFVFQILSNRDLARRLHDRFRQVRLDMAIEEVHQQEILRQASLQLDRLAHIPSIWPTHGRLSSRFGYRSDPFTGRRQFHRGVDISGLSGTRVYATANGVITRAGRYANYGLTIDVQHSEGIWTRYAHLSRIAVEVGQEVRRGDLIGYMGNTGRSRAPHLHYEVRVNKRAVNPLDYILN